MIPVVIVFLVGLIAFLTAVSIDQQRKVSRTLESMAADLSVARHLTCELARQEHPELAHLDDDAVMAWALRPRSGDAA